MSAADLSLPPPSEASAEVAARVAAARTRQAARYAKLPEDTRPNCNAEADGQVLDDAAERLALSARGYHRVLRVARTLADLDGAETVSRPHIAEALAYRRVAPGR